MIYKLILFFFIGAVISADKKPLYQRILLKSERYLFPTFCLYFIAAKIPKKKLNINRIQKLLFFRSPILKKTFKLLDQKYIYPLFGFLFGITAIFKHEELSKEEFEKKELQLKKENKENKELKEIINKLQEESNVIMVKLGEFKEKELQLTKKNKELEETINKLQEKSNVIMVKLGEFKEKELQLTKKNKELEETISIQEQKSDFIMVKLIEEKLFNSSDFKNIRKLILREVTDNSLSIEAFEEKIQTILTTRKFNEKILLIEDKKEFNKKLEEDGIILNKLEFLIKIANVIENEKWEKYSNDQKKSIFKKVMLAILSEDNLNKNIGDITTSILQTEE